VDRPTRWLLAVAGFALGLLLSVRPAAGQSDAPLVRVETEITGLEGELLANAEAVVSLALAEEPIRPARALVLYERAPDELRMALEPFGFYLPEIDASVVRNEARWAARLAVDPGPPTIVEDVDFALTGPGAADSSFAALRDSLAIAVGDTLRHAPYEAAKALFFRYARNHGYFEARFDSAQILVTRGESSARIAFHFETGQRYLFGPITVQQDVLDTDHVDGYVTAVEGEPFDAGQLRASQVALTTGPWFGRADLELDIEGADDLRVPVTFVLTPSRPQRYEIAGGYGTDTGFRGTLGVRFRRLNRKAHNAEAELRVSQVEISVGGRYNIPRPAPSTAVYSIFGSFGDVSPTWSSTLVGTLGLSRSQQRGPLRETLSVQWEEASYEAAAIEGSSTLVVPQVAWTWLAADDRVLATRGHRLNLTLSGGLDGVGSTTTFASAHLQTTLIRSFTRRARWILRGDAGWIRTDDLLDLPPTRRFVTGGAQSVRGFAFETIGPGADADALVGGSTLLVGSVEADYEVIPRWRLAGFADVGDAMDTFADFDAELGVGLGIRWVSPLGMIRFDFASPLSDPTDRFRLHFVFGPDL
jgi:translocation and assembly module TamA